MTSQSSMFSIKRAVYFICISITLLTGSYILNQVKKSTLHLTSFRGELISIEAHFDGDPEKRSVQAFAFDSRSGNNDHDKQNFETGVDWSEDLAGGDGSEKTRGKKDVNALNLTLDERQKARKSLVQQVCKKNLALIPNMMYMDTLRHIYVIDKYKLLFCYIPKVGCSNWKRVLMVLAGKKKDLTQITSREAHAHNGLKMLARLSKWEQKYVLKEYTKVMFVRQPFSRIVSAYKNKYGDLDVYRTAPITFHRYAKRIIKKYRENPSFEALETGENITWSEFVEYLTDSRERPNFDRHWKEMYKLCSPCKVKYDFIGHLEQIDQEANYVLSKLPRALSVVRYPGKANSHPTNTGSSAIDRQFTNFSSETIGKLWNIYKDDFQLFGYDKPIFVP